MHQKQWAAIVYGNTIDNSYHEVTKLYVYLFQSRLYFANNAWSSKKVKKKLLLILLNLFS